MRLTADKNVALSASRPALNLCKENTTVNLSRRFRPPEPVCFEDLIYKHKVRNWRQNKNEEQPGLMWARKDNYSIHN